jgi:5-oxoprolinase (ATP-hydrolysing)
VKASRWQIWIDRGGTFTDCIGLDPATNELRVAKVLSSDRAPLDGIRKLLGLAVDTPIPPSDIRMGTTLATNALLERKGCPTALLVTRGFGDLLAIGTQARPELFRLNIEKPPPLPVATVEVDARHDASGRVLERPAPDSLAETLSGLAAAGARSVAVSLLHAYRAPELELEVGAAARRAGFAHVSLSHEVAPEIGLLGRTDTTLLDAYLTPLLSDYLRSLAAELPGSTLLLMQSSGGLASAAALRGPSAILSGPAGGVVAVAEIATRAGLQQAIGFDMGGTSTDVCRFAGELERIYESEVAGVRVRAPMMRIHTVAAGGGSICKLDAGRLVVGPESAGARPGPLAYGDPAAHDLTLTDVNLLLGRLADDRFPFPLERQRAEARLTELARTLDDPARGPLDVAEGFFHVANSAMAEAIRKVSVARGYDVREHALVVMGGAGGQHACALARRLGIREVVVHPLAGVLSAWGIGLSAVRWNGDRDAGRALLDASALDAVEPVFAEMEAAGRSALGEQIDDAAAVRVERRLDLRYRGSETVLTLPVQDATSLTQSFHAEHERAFGHARPEHPIEVAVARLEVSVAGFGAQPGTAAGGGSRREPRRFTLLHYEGRSLDHVPVHHREDLGPGDVVEGPALVLEPTSTTVVDPGFRLEVNEGGLLRIRDHAGSAALPELVGALDDSIADPVLLEIMQSSFMGIAEQMGETLRRTAFSTNIRERLDFSCALFDAEGGLVANAPHIPVHLGAMSETVRALRVQHRDMRAGDVFVTNDPAAGGSHLPDITVVTPLFDEADRLRFFTACRGHHADVGGITPGSMPPSSTCIEEEGVVLRGLRLVQGGRFDRASIEAALSSGPHPARDPGANILDLEAQVAANRTGAALVAELLERYGLPRVEAYMRHVQRDAAERVARQIEQLGDGTHRFTDALDDGTPICVTLEVHGRHLVVDFAGTGTEHAGNLNAPRAVTLAAVIYFLRALVDAPIPLNSGCLDPVEVRIPPASILDPSPGRAVAGGNVETSQRVVDVLLGAAGLAAASQGTMNNLTFGGEGFAYYETIAGGAGAGPTFDGASAVHTHMTNTRITDPEVLEARFPVRLLRFAVRHGSGGAGRRHGGDGVIRELEFLVPARVAILSERRERPPFGLAGGMPGARGVNRLDGRELPGRASADVTPGSRIVIETPGGGGYGAPDTG